MIFKTYLPKSLFLNDATQVQNEKQKQIVLYGQKRGRRESAKRELSETSIKLSLSCDLPGCLCLKPTDSGTVWQYLLKSDMSHPHLTFFKLWEKTVSFFSSYRKNY